MQTHKRILFITNGLRDESGALREMDGLLGDSIARLTILAVTPTIPSGIQNYVEDFDQKVAAKLEADYRKLKTKPAEAVDYKVERSDQPFLAIIQNILANDYDAVVKTAEPTTRTHGYDALDMSLLRKCPTPLWLLKPSAATGGESPGTITVAIDPVFAESGARQLSLALLREADAVAARQSAPLQIVACWTSPLGTARGNPFLNITEEQVEEESRTIRDAQFETLTKLIDECGVQSPYEIVQLNGDPAPAIPAYTKKAPSRLLVMGTVARTGIPGFIMGNTAENIFHELACSIVAIKPPGWVCPIKPK
ncbi:MAG: universal stress protein [Leptospirales bacterium]|jgi:universal stress protein E